MWLAFEVRGFVVEVKKRQKGRGEERNRENSNHGETFVRALGLGYFQ